MKWCLLLFLVAVVVEAVPFEGPRWSYHEKVGIPMSEQLKKFELAANSSRIVGGTSVPLGKHPFMVGIVIHLFTPATSVCGASLLTHTRSLTAAHCWYDGWRWARMFTMVFGSQRLHIGGLRIDTEDVEMHPDWNPLNLNNDVAIVRHDWVAFNDITRPINLPIDQVNNDFAGSWAVAVGYGRQFDSQVATFNPDLREAHLQVVPNEVCWQLYPSLVADSTLCTRGPIGTNICQGDSGGPLALETGDDRIILIGIVSFGALSCEGGHPAGYARVTSFLPWILSRN